MKYEDIHFNGLKVGFIVDDKLYVSPRKQSKHLYRGGKKTVAEAKKSGSASWGISNELLKVLKTRGIEIIAIDDSETKKTYWRSISRFERESIFLDFGGDLQRFLNLNNWSVTEFNSLVKATQELVECQRKGAA